MSRTAGEARAGPATFRPLFLALGIVWCGVIFGASSLPGMRTPLPFLVRWVFNSGHAVVFAVLSFLMVSGVPRRRIAWAVAALACALYGASDEWHQSFVVGRSPAVTDWITDCCGVVLGLIVTRIAQDPAAQRARLLALAAGMGVLCGIASLVATLA